MKNIFIIVIFCFIKLGVLGQGNNDIFLKTVAITLERSTEVGPISATAERTENISKPEIEERNCCAGEYKKNHCCPIKVLINHEASCHIGLGL